MQNTNRLTKLRLSTCGFSLIELLIVMVIVGIILGFAVLAFGDFGVSRRINMSQQHLVDLIKLARFKAIIESNTYGLKVEKYQYSFYKFYHKPNSPYGQWHLINKTPFNNAAFPEHSKVSFSKALDAKEPNITFSPEGHITSFSLKLEAPNKDASKIIVEQNSEVKLVEISPND